MDAKQINNINANKSLSLNPAFALLFFIFTIIAMLISCKEPLKYSLVFIFPENVAFLVQS